MHIFKEGEEEKKGVIGLNFKMSAVVHPACIKQCVRNNWSGNDLKSMKSITQFLTLKI